MKPGIKIGLLNWRKRLGKSQAAYVEVYFMVSQFKEYQAMFSYLKKKKIKFGLHFWAKLKSDYMPNLVFKDKVAGESCELIKQAIDIAARAGAHYVNIHPGSFRLKKVDFISRKMIVNHQQADFAEGKKEFFKNAKMLNNYAKKKGVLFLIETVCKREAADWSGKRDARLKTQNALNVNSQTLYELAKKENISLTNDFGHTLTETISDDRKKIFRNLFLTTKKLAPFTKLIHSNTTSPPFNGTDGHGGLLESDFKNKVLPNKVEIIKLFKIFKNRKDIWLIPEPLKSHIANFKALKKLIKKAQITG